jgi:hypothetical protein
MSATERSQQVASAERALEAARSQLAAARADETFRRSVANRKRVVATAWSAALHARETIDRWQIARVLPAAILPLPATFLGFVFVAEVTGMVALGAATAVVVFTTLVALATFLWLVPGDRVVRQQWAMAQTAASEAASQLATAQRIMRTRGEDVAAASARLQNAQEAEAAFRKTVAYQCNALYQRPWRDMRAAEFEGFLAEVLRSLGYDVEQTGQSGDQGVDLVAVKNGRRIAVQAKGYSGSVGNSAVQEAFAGMAHYGCHGCAVVTNSSFTTAAVSLAASTNCLLVHQGNFREFVFGELMLTAN